MFVQAATTLRGTSRVATPPDTSAPPVGATRPAAAVSATDVWIAVADAVAGEPRLMMCSWTLSSLSRFSMKDALPSPPRSTWSVTTVPAASVAPVRFVTVMPVALAAGATAQPSGALKTCCPTTRA